MDESGISVGYDLVEHLDANDLYILNLDPETEIEIPVDSGSLPKEIDYYELNSKTLPQSEPPNFKTATATTRTQLKQQLQRQQWQELEKKKSELGKVEKSTPLRVPMNLPSIEVPQQVLEVRTGLQNPTLYHMKQKQKHQVLQYLSTSQENESVKKNVTFSLKKNRGVSSAPISNIRSISISGPSSPDLRSPSASSIATSEVSSVTSEHDDAIVDDILSYEEDHGLKVSHSQYNLSKISQITRKNNSCPSDILVKSEPTDDFRDRIKKETHNMIERKRRYNINDKIKELGTLLPKNHDPHYDLVRDNKQNKGTILKSTVDYIRLLKEDSEEKKRIERENRRLGQHNRELLLRIHELENIVQKHGIQVREATWRPVPVTAIVNRRNNHHQMPDVVRQVQEIDAMDDDARIVNNDLMLNSSSSPSQDVEME